MVSISEKIECRVWLILGTLLYALCDGDVWGDRRKGGRECAICEVEEEADFPREGEGGGVE